MNRFAKAFDHTTGQQILVVAQYSPVPCGCQNALCQGFVQVPTLAITTRLGWGELRMVIAPDTNPLAPAQENERLMRFALDEFTAKDASEALETMLSGYHEAITMVECGQQVDALRRSIIARAQLLVDAAS